MATAPQLTTTNKIGEGAAQILDTTDVAKSSILAAQQRQKMLDEYAKGVEDLMNNTDVSGIRLPDLQDFIIPELESVRKYHLNNYNAINSSPTSLESLELKRRYNELSSLIYKAKAMGGDVKNKLDAFSKNAAFQSNPLNQNINKTLLTGKTFIKDKGGNLVLNPELQEAASKPYFTIGKVKEATDTLTNLFNSGKYAEYFNVNPDGTITQTKDFSGWENVREDAKNVIIPILMAEFGDEAPAKADEILNSLVVERSKKFVGQKGGGSGTPQELIEDARPTKISLETEEGKSENLNAVSIPTSTRNRYNLETGGFSVKNISFKPNESGGFDVVAGGEELVTDIKTARKYVDPTVRLMYNSFDKALNKVSEIQGKIDEKKQSLEEVNNKLEEIEVDEKNSGRSRALDKNKVKREAREINQNIERLERDLLKAESDGERLRAEIGETITEQRIKVPSRKVIGTYNPSSGSYVSTVEFGSLNNETVKGFFEKSGATAPSSPSPSNNLDISEEERIKKLMEEAGVDN